MIKRLFQIQVLHTYFQSGFYENCSIKPDESTGKVFQRYGLFTRMQHGAFECFNAFSIDAKSLIDELKEHLQGQPLRFFLCANEAQFVFITQLSIQWLGQLHASSKSLDVGDPSEKDHGTKLLATFGPRTVDQHEVIGVISVYPDDLHVEGGTSNMYLLELKARCLAWHYYVINRSQTKLHDPFIRDKHLRCLNGPDPIVLPNGENGLCFNSGLTEFPLQEIPNQTFDLMDRLPSTPDMGGSSIEHCVISGLPTPTMDSLKFEAGNKHIFGAMYVYLQ